MQELQATANGRKVRYNNGDGKLEIVYDDHVEAIQHNHIIAVIEVQASAEEESPIPLYNILQVRPSSSGGYTFAFEAISATRLPDSFLQLHLGPSRPSCLHVPSTAGKPNFHIVISVRSGLGEAEQFFTRVVSPALAAYGIQESQCHVVTTVSETSITELARDTILPRAKAGIQQTILLLSGDGGIVDFVNVFQSHDPGVKEEEPFVRPVLGLVALGTGNAMANSTGINSDATRGLRHFFRGVAKRLPTFVATFSPGSELLINEGEDTETLGPKNEVHGAVVCSWGLHASLVADSDTTEYRKHGSNRFQMAAKELLEPSDGSAPHVYKGQVSPFIKGLNHEKSQTLDRHEHMYTLATMVSNLEEKLCISPSSKPLDGRMRLLHFGPMSSDRVMNILGRAFTDGSHVGDEAVSYQEIDGLRIDFDEKDSRWRRVCVDGKIVKVCRNGWVTVQTCSESPLDLLVLLRAKS